MWRWLYDRSGRPEGRWLVLSKRALLIAKSLWLVHSDLGIVSGEDGSTVRGAYIGEGLSLPYYRKLYGSTTRNVRRIPIWKLESALRQARARCPVVLVELNPLLAFLLPHDGWTADPWVQQEVDLHGESYLNRRRGIERRWGREVRRQGYQCRFSHNKGALKEFYREHYVPYLLARHGENASIRRLSDLNAALRSGFLLQIWQGADWVSGSVVSQDHGRLRLLAVGMKAPHLLQQSALSATYYFLMRWALDNGFRTVNFCGSRPHLMDGVFLHKSLWGAEPKHDPWHHTRISFFIDSGASLPRIVSQQLVTEAGSYISIRECLAKKST